MSGLSEIQGEVTLDVKQEFHEIAVDRINSSPFIQDLHSLLRCRLCAIPKNAMVDIFTIHETERDIASKIEYCLRVAVKESDTLPKQVCWPCVKELERCYRFIESVKEAEKQLLALDKQITRKFEITEIRFRPSSSYNAHCEATFDYNTENVDIKSPTIAEQEQPTGSIVESSLVSPSSTGSGVLDSDENISASNLTNDEWRSSDDNECQKVDSSTTNLNTEQKSENDIVQQSNCDFEVSVMTRSRFQAEKNKTSSAQCKEGSQDIRMKQENTTVPEESLIASSDLNRHPKKMKKGNHCCSVCGKSFKWQSAMKIHMAVHSNKKSWKCDYCNKGYKTKRHLQRHSTVCQNQIYKCHFCATLLATKAALIRHMRLHTEERPYSCDYCGKKYTSKQNRDNHHRMHDGERPFKCSMCAKTFSRAEYLQRHAAVHSDEKMFPCSLCDKSYKRAKARKFHMATVHINVKI